MNNENSLSTTLRGIASIVLFVSAVMVLLSAVQFGNYIVATKGLVLLALWYIGSRP
jgi:hypothetical protein